MEFEGRFIDIMEVFNVDKYEFNIKLEQIKKLAAKKEYKQAAEIAKQMNWNKVKDWSTLAMIINVQEAAGYYEEAISKSSTLIKNSVSLYISFLPPRLRLYARIAISLASS